MDSLLIEGFVVSFLLVRRVDGRKGEARERNKRNQQARVEGVSVNVGRGSWAEIHGPPNYLERFSLRSLNLPTSRASPSQASLSLYGGVLSN